MRPELAEGNWKVAHFVQQNSSASELFFQQNEPFMHTSFFTFVFDLSLAVESVGQNVNTFLNSLQTQEKDDEDILACIYIY